MVTNYESAIVGVYLAGNEGVNTSPPTLMTSSQLPSKAPITDPEQRSVARIFLLHLLVILRIITITSRPFRYSGRVFPRVFSLHA